VDALASDARSPGVRVLLGVRRGIVQARSEKMAISGTIEAPFSVDEISALVDRYPVEAAPPDESEPEPGRRSVP